MSSNASMGNTSMAEVSVDGKGSDESETEVIKAKSRVEIGTKSSTY